MILKRDPYIGCGNVFVVVTIDVARPRHLFPRNRGLPGLDLVRQATRRFGDNLKAPRHGINRAEVCPECLSVEARSEVSGKVDVIRDVVQGSGRGVRRHKQRCSWRPGERRA